MLRAFSMFNIHMVLGVGNQFSKQVLGASEWQPFYGSSTPPDFKFCHCKWLLSLGCTGKESRGAFPLSCSRFSASLEVRLYLMPSESALAWKQQTSMCLSLLNGERQEQTKIGDLLWSSTSQSQASPRLWGSWTVTGESALLLTAHLLIPGSVHFDWRSCVCFWP